MIKAAPKPKSGNSETGSADVAVHYIRQLYAIEKRVQKKELPSKDLFRERQQRAKPILDEFKGWLDRKSGKTLPKGCSARPYPIR